MEVIRDVAAQNGWTAEQIAHVQRAITIHEIGHQFGLTHSGNLANPETISVMTVHDGDAQEGLIPNITLHFTEEDIHKIRNHGTATTPHP